MGRKSKPPERAESPAGALKHNPFAALGGRLGDATVASAPVAPTPAPRPPQVLDPTAELRFPDKVHIRLETKGRGGKTVTRLSGIQVSQLAEVASRMRKSFGCGATVEGEDVILLGALEERARAWLIAQGAKRLSQGNAPPAPAQETVLASAAGPEPKATVRANIRRGIRVAVVLKQDQESGELTMGVVSDVLTNSPQHPRGIKVRLESGEVGRVQRILN